MIELTVFAAAVFIYVVEIKAFFDSFLIYGLLFLNILIAGQSYLMIKLSRVRRVRMFCAVLFVISLIFIFLRVAYITTGNVFFFYAIPSFYISIWLALFYGLTEYEDVLKIEKRRFATERAAARAARKRRNRNAEFYNLKMNELEKISERAEQFITEQPNHTENKFLH